MTTTKSTVSGILKNVYDTYVAQMQNLEHRAIDEIGKSTAKYNAGGNGFYGAINDYGNESGGAINETEAFRTIDNENYQQYVVTPKVLVWPVEFSGLIARAAETDEESFANAAVREIDMAKERLLSDENRQFFGLGTGLLCNPTGAIASDVTSFAVDTTQYVRNNMVIDIFNGATKTVDSKRITRVDRQNNVIYFATSIGAVLNATSAIIKENIRDSAASDGKEMMGLRGIVDDSTELTTFQNLNASTNDLWRATRISAASGNLTSDMLQRLVDEVALISGKEPTKLAMHPNQRRKYLDMVVPQKRYMDGEMDAGHKKLTFNGQELWLEKDCQVATLYALTLSELRKFELAPIEMGRHDGSDAFLRTSGTDVFQAYWRHYCNFGTAKRTAHGKLVALATPTGVA